MTCTPHNDEPDIDINLLPERQRLLKKLVEDIRQCRPPMVFGVHGDWGAGKTSFLQAVMYELTGKCPQRPEATAGDTKAHPKWKENPPVAVWFEAWRYQNESAPVVALLHELRENLRWSTHPVSKGVQKAKDAALTLWNTAFLAFDSLNARVEAEMDAGIGKVKAGVSFNPIPIARARDEVAKARHATPLPSNQIRDALNEILSRLLGMTPSKSERIVIFIDDLDRCTATAMFSLLESIKIYLNLEKCVFVLGINRHELERNIASVLPEPIAADQRQVRAHEYIEKLCGNIVRLPYPSPKAQPLLVGKWLGSLDVIRREELLRLVKDYAFLPLNPRRIKMWCNTVMQLHDHRVMELVAAPPVEEMAALALAAALHTFYPTLHQSIAVTPSFLISLKRWCDAEYRAATELEALESLCRVYVTPPFITEMDREEKEVLGQLRFLRERTVPDFACLEPGSRERELQMFMERFQNDVHQLIIRSSQLESARIEKLKPVLKRALGWESLNLEAKDASSEPTKPKRIPLLSDPSSLSYFHPQRLVADESITEELIKHYLHLD